MVLNTFSKNKDLYLKVFVLIALIVGLYFFLGTRNKKGNSDAQSKDDSISAYNAFILKEDSISKEFTMIDEANMIVPEFRTFKDCDEFDKYQKYEDMDTRDMSISNLQEAIDLNEKCAYQIVKEKQFRLNLLDTDISDLFGLSEQIQPEKLKFLSKSVAEKWREVSANEADFTNQINLYAQNFPNYWIVEVDYKSHKTTLSRRNELFSAYDAKGTEIDDKLVELDPKRKTILNQKNDLLKQLRAAGKLEKYEF